MIRVDQDEMRRGRSAGSATTGIQPMRPLQRARILFCRASIMPDDKHTDLTGSDTLQRADYVAIEAFS
jgi:hypothetical protein